MIFYSIESDDNGDLWCVNNYDKMPWWPYSIDSNGNFIVEQDDNDTAIYSINENMELEVELTNG